MSKDTWSLGKWLVLCDRCGFERTNDKLKKEWTGLMVCADTCWEPRHPQDFVRAKPEENKVTYTRPEPADQFVSVTYVDSSVGVQETTIPSGTNNNGLD